MSTSMTIAQAAEATGLPLRAMLHYAQLRRQGNTVDSLSQRRALLQSGTLAVKATLAELQGNLRVLQQKIALYGELEQQAVLDQVHATTT